MENSAKRNYLYIKDTLIHKQLILKAGLRLIKYLYNNGRDQEAIELARRCGVHDQSKLLDDEMKCMTQLPLEGPKSKTKHPNLNEEEKKLIQLHWSRNKHHPEYFQDYHEMSEIDIMEMCCDWYARSIQFKSSLMEYANNSNKMRFHFDEQFFEKIIKYCKILEGTTTAAE